MNIEDESGKYRFGFCFFLLLTNHGLRDYMITSIALIASQYQDYNVTETEFLIHSPPILKLTLANDSEISEQYSDLHSSLDKFVTFLTPINEKVLSKHGFMETRIGPSINQISAPKLKEGWSALSIGLVLGIIHWPWAIALILAPFVINPKKLKPLLALNLFCCAVIAIFTDLSTHDGKPATLITMRALQGFTQGWCYPLTYFILYNLPTKNFVIPYFFVFLAPWIGSSIGLIIGAAEETRYLGSYAFGLTCLILAVLCLFLPISGKKFKYKHKTIWKEILTSIPVWSCVLSQAIGIFVLHTFIVGYALTLDFLFFDRNKMWTVCVMVFLGGISTRILAFAAKALMRENFLSALNRRRFVISAGNVILVVALILNGTISVDSEWGLFSSCLVGISFGSGLCLVGTRLNLHDLNPTHPIPILNLSAIGGAIGAGTASILFPVLANVGDITNGQANYGPYRLGWLVPIGLIILTALFHIFTISVNPLPYQISSTPLNVNNGEIPNGVISTITAAYSQEMDTKSFKSLVSGVSFKTAVSGRSKTRSSSFKTVEEEFSEVDLRSAVGSDKCYSVAPEDDELKSIKSGTTFRSAVNDDERNEPIILDAQKINQTQDWLTTNHNTRNEDKFQISRQKNLVERNVMIAAQW